MTVGIMDDEGARSGEKNAWVRCPATVVTRIAIHWVFAAQEGLLLGNRRAPYEPHKRSTVDDIPTCHTIPARLRENKSIVSEAGRKQDSQISILDMRI